MDIIIISCCLSAFFSVIALFIFAYFAYKNLKQKIDASLYFFDNSVRTNIVRAENRVDELIVYANKQIVVPADLQNLRRKICELEKLAEISVETTKTTLIIVEKMYKIEEKIKAMQHTPALITPKNF